MDCTVFSFKTNNGDHVRKIKMREKRLQILPLKTLFSSIMDKKARYHGQKTSGDIISRLWGKINDIITAAK